MKITKARANANIALVKYWGKADSELNIPAVASLSLTLNDFYTTVALSAASCDSHELYREGQIALDSSLTRLSSFLELARAHYKYEGYFRVEAHSNIPFSAGLASSAAFFAAAAKALSHHLGLNLNLRELSCLARLGSASAARSIYAHCAGLWGGTLKHLDAHAFPLETKLDLNLIVATISEGLKPFSSREAMNITAATSPFFPAFVATSGKDFDVAQGALSTSNFEKLGHVMEQSTLKMHSSMWVATPSINYLQPQSLELINMVYDLRKTYGPIAYFTMDAGPNVKILCEAQHSSMLVEKLGHSGLTLSLKAFSPGQGATLLEDA